MKLTLVIVIATLLTSATPSGAEESAFDIGAAPPTFIRKLEPDRLLTSGGIKVTSGGDVTVEPEFGVSHIVHQREVGGAQEDTTHKVHALAGGRVSLSDRFYLGFATKLPVYNYGATEVLTPGGGLPPATAQRHEYEILKLSPENLTWTGEMGFRLGPRIDLNLYYDQNILKSPYQSGGRAGEEVFGTRFILRFK